MLWEAPVVLPLPQAYIENILYSIGEEPSREGLVETPDRVVKAWETWFGGYNKDPAEVLKTFKDGAEGVDEMVLETDIPVYSHCEHHMAPIFGVAHVAYVPNGRVVGLSKLVRLVDVFARRLQVQERLTTQIADALEEHLKPLGVGVILQCRHMCMESRGVNRPGVVTTTSALRGAVKDEHDTRAEFLNLINLSQKRGPL
jgi:GTP cyclohydrolase I